MRALIPPAEDWLILDTSALTIEDAAAAIMTRVRPWLVSPQASRCAIARG
jgi:cytidylate kinase